MNRYKKIVALMTALMFVFVVFAACRKQNYDCAYGVFLGIDEIDAAEMRRYDLVVIDAAAIEEKSEIAELQACGTAVYSYLNVGTIEEYRDYYQYFLDLGILLKIYDDWPDERWVDVSDARWQTYAVETIAANLIQSGIDGFFLDNFDVYYEYENQSILNGLIAILQGLKDTYSLPLMVNGGDTAVKEILRTKPGLIDAVNQECVFTNIDFENDRLTVQDADTTEYYKEYLAYCKIRGLDIYILEYGNKVIRSTIDNFCKANGYFYYVSKDLDLTQAQY